MTIIMRVPGPGQLHQSGGAPGLEPEHTEQTARGLDEALLL